MELEVICDACSVYQEWVSTFAVGIALIGLYALLVLVLLSILALLYLTYVLKLTILVVSEVSAAKATCNRLQEGQSRSKWLFPHWMLPFDQLLGHLQLLILKNWHFIIVFVGVIEIIWVAGNLLLILI